MSAPTTDLSVFHGVDETDDGRWYLIDELRLISVTTVTGVIDKAALKRWAAKLAAEACLIELPTVVTSSRKKPCGRTTNRCGHDWRETCHDCPCAECKTCVTKWLADRHLDHTRRRADEGTRTHDVVEWWALTGEWKPFDPDIAPYVAAFKALVAEYGIRPEDFLLSEAIVVDRKHGYAGTTDGVVRIHAERTEAAAKLVSRLTGINWRKCQQQKLTVDLVIDCKTKETPGPKFYPEQALQVTGYRHAPRVRIKNTDEEHPMPPTDGGAILQLRPDGATLRLVVTDDRTYRRGFLSFLTGCLWLIEDGPASVSSHTFVLPETIAARARKANAQPPAADVEPELVKPVGAKKTTTAAARKTSKPARPLAERVLGSAPPMDLLIDDSIPF